MRLLISQIESPWPFAECLRTAEVSFAEALFPVTWKSRGANLVSDLTGKRGLRIGKALFICFSLACVRLVTRNI